MLSASAHVSGPRLSGESGPSLRRAAECLCAEALKGAAPYLRSDSGSRVRLPVRAWLGPATAAVAGSGRSTRCSSAARMARGAALQTRRRLSVARAGFVVIKPVPSPCGCSRRWARPWSRERASQSSARGGAPRGSSVRDRETCSRGARSPRMTRAGRTPGRGHRACPSL